jgi:PAS domain S-box-containing protein
MCYLWQPGILGLHVVSDFLIMLAYFSIPFTLVYFVRKRTDLRFIWIFVCFAIFIVACGASHFMEIWTIWFPTYWLSGGIKAITALASVPTAILLIKLVPLALRLPSPAALEAANATLLSEAAERKRAEVKIQQINDSLEARVIERTAQLQRANQILHAEMRERQQSQELLAVTLSSIGDGVIVADTAGRIIFINEAAERLGGTQLESVRGLPLGEVFQFVSAANRTPLPVDASTISRPGVTEDAILIGRDGKEILIDLRGAPLQEDQATIRGLVLTFRDDTERKGIQSELINTNARFAIAAEAAGLGFWEYHVSTNSLRWDHRMYALYGRAGLEGHQPYGIWADSLHPDDREAGERTIVDALKGTGKCETEFRVVHPSGEIRHLKASFGVARDGEGRALRMFGVNMDITERQRAEVQLRHLNAALEERILARTAELKEREVMLQEIHHRVKNNLQVIASLLSMQVRALGDPATRDALQQCRSRVETMAQIHEMLYQAQDYARVPFAKYAKNLATRVLSASRTSASSIDFDFDLEDLALPVDKAIPCGLILNELIANSLKHAFPPGRSGRISVTFRRLTEATILLSVGDDGIGIPPDYEVTKLQSLGMQLVTTLVNQLDATLEMTGQPGSTFRITLPVESHS